MWLSCFSACLDSRCLCCSRHMWHPCCFSITCGSEPRCERGVQNAVCWLHEISSLYWKSVIYTVFLSCLESMLYSYAWYDILSSSAVMVIDKVLSNQRNVFCNHYYTLTLKRAHTCTSSICVVAMILRVSECSLLRPIFGTL